MILNFAANDDHYGDDFRPSYTTSNYGDDFQPSYTTSRNETTTTTTTKSPDQKQTTKNWLFRKTSNATTIPGNAADNSNSNRIDTLFNVGAYGGADNDYDGDNPIIVLDDDSPKRGFFIFFILFVLVFGRREGCFWVGIDSTSFCLSEGILLTFFLKTEKMENVKRLEVAVLHRDQSCNSLVKYDFIRML